MRSTLADIERSAPAPSSGHQTTGALRPSASNNYWLEPNPPTNFTRARPV